MTKASDNAFPSVLITEGTEPSAPAAGKQRLYIDSTSHHLKRTDSSGTDVDLETNQVAGGMATDALWDAAGDLAVGTGANTGAKLSIGAAGGAVSRINGAVAWNSGTSMPTGATGDRYWRTDLREEFMYDGTRWVTVARYTWDIQGTAQAVSATATAGIVAAGLLDGRSDIWIEDIRVSVFINGGTALSASHKWVFTLEKIVQDSVTVTNITTISFDSGASSQWRDLAGSIDALLNNGTVHDAIQVTLTKTGTPGAISFGIAVTYRYVAT